MTAARCGEPPATAAAASLESWLARLESRHPLGQAGIELGLERVRRVKDVLGHALRCPLITVGGTNGKGSTCAYLEAIYRLAGFRVGCYTSPHLLTYNERVRVDGLPVADQELCAAFARVEQARNAAGEVALTYFEFGTLAALEVFRARQVEVVILEVGLGGRLDAVNAYDADCAVVTSIALDHTDWLGPTRASVAFEKAGIFRADTPALCADADPPPSLVEHALAIGADLHLLGRDFGYFGDQQQWTFWGRGGLRRGGLANPGLRGRCQLRNASAALAAVELLRSRLPVAMSAVRRGLIELDLPGRFQVLPGRPVIVLDVAHNPQAVGELADNLGGMGFFAKTIAVVGMLADKDIAGSLAPLAGKADLWLLADLELPRGAAAAALAEVVNGAGLGGRVECLSSPTQAFARAVSLAGENDRIAVFGSFYTVAAVMRSIKDGR
ncbi:MAG: bifunctional tetrahydrofolate synthase/dihydrofolate synthase [Candidatus Accumulibacter sp.]|uniref:bifunctional tetrahydrofolate synthase/dihydrofolate synthase n=1 Tax=Accumulibacter sp. TaxID=2053492 RepID=UPI001A0A296B|nr:bifunctional tetrahydrofolate synthase/dihydrofolate synthase [Accumulibacter sp.]MBE2257748.1 bifunctional tetrahydrofolate synthase/dihydrofolate synthase [Paracoccaceae bacterium]MCP5248747.1 bifunctional tetrahydrofolate synthase/dihydrofolate synthase [Accumulibacter sp.]